MRNNLRYSLIILLLVGFYFFQRSQVVLKPSFRNENVSSSQVGKHQQAKRNTIRTSSYRPAEEIYSVPSLSISLPNDFLPYSTGGEKVSHDSYTLSYLEEYEQAEWVAYKLNRSYISGVTKRCDCFQCDDKVKSKSAFPEDYKASGYDRGHLLPAADRKNSKLHMRETFLMSNICPQDPLLNRKAWKDLEELLREALSFCDSLYVVTGPIFGQNPTKIGESQVSVPHSFYKVILNYSRSNQLCATAFLFPNKPVEILDPKYIVSIDSIEQVTDINFFAAFPSELQEQFESVNCLQLLE